MKRVTTQVDPSDALEKFQQFLFEMSDDLESFVTQARKAAFDLDYTLGSLEALEQFVLKEIDSSNESELKNRAARYLGEVFRKNLGGKWELCLKDPKYLFYRLPVVSGYSKIPIEFCPIAVINNFTAKRQAGLIKRAVESHLEFVA